MTDPVAATNTINQKLDDRGVFNTVTRSEVQAAADVLRDPQLDAGETRQVIDSLARSGKLDKFAAEMVDGNILPGQGGLSASDRQQFFADMAKKLDGASLAKLSAAFAKTEGGLAGRTHVEELGKAVATHGSQQAKLDYVRALAPSTTDKPSSFTTFFGGSMTFGGDAEARAVGQVIGSLRGDAAKQAFNSLNADQFKAVMSASVETMTTSSQGGASTSYDAKAYSGLATAAASVNDPAFKAKFFAESANVLRDVRGAAEMPGKLFATGGSAATAAVRDGMTKVLDSDTTGIMGQLTYGRSTLDGSAMSAYAKAMLNGGQEKKLGEFMSKLALGNDGTGNPVERMNQSVRAADGTDQRVNAGAMGYFVGSVYKAAESITSDVKAQQEFANAVLKSALTIVDKTQPWGKPVGIAASVAKEWTVYAVRAAIQDPGNSAATQLERAALPIDPTTDRIAVGDAATNALGTAIARVQRLAKP
jgi:hypothetical protein